VGSFPVNQGGQHTYAAGMFSAAEGQLGNNGLHAQKEDLSDIMGTLEQGESVEIVALSEEASQQAALILQQRQKQSNPVKAYMRNLQCDSYGDADNSENPSMKKKEADKTPPMLRLARNTMPIMSWMPALDLRIIRADLIAGLTVGVMVIPQGMSYANIAGLEYIYGMYSACIPTAIYALFGQSRQLAVGPVAMVSLLVEAGLRDKITRDMAMTEGCRQWFDGTSKLTSQNEACPDEYAELAFTVAFFVGAMQFFGSLMKLGFLVSFLGHPVTSGFTSGAAIIIGLSQVKYWLGFDIKKSQFVNVTIEEIIKNLGKTKPMPLILGLTWLLFLVLNKKIAAKYKRLKLLGPMGPLISCTVGILLLWLCEPLRDKWEVSYVGFVPSGFQAPSIGKLRFEKIGELLPTAATACLIGYMESVAIGKSLASKHGYEIDAGQEMLALGISNLVGGCFNCYPVTGSFSRSAVMNSTGGMTQLGGLISAVVMFFTLLFLTKLFWFLPKYALAAIVINSVIPLVAVDGAKKLYQVKKNDFVLWVVAFLCTMFLGILLGILISVCLSLVIVIYESVRPQISILWRIPGTSIYRNVKQESSGAFIPNVFICRIGSSLYFANAAFVKDMLLAFIEDLEEVNTTEYVVLEMTSVISVDSTAVHVVQDVVNDFRARGIQVAFAMTGNRVEKTFRRAGLKKFIGEQWFFPTVNEAVHYCLRHQHAKLNRADSKKQPHAIEVGDVNVHAGNEIGFSNELHHEGTTIFIVLVQDIPMIMSEITGVYSKNKISVIRAQIEPVGQNGAKHTYLVKSIKNDKKLTDLEIERLREDLQNVVINMKKKATSSAKVAALSQPTVSPDQTVCLPKDNVYDSSRLARLEDALEKEQDNNKKIQMQLQQQNERLDRVLQIHEKASAEDTSDREQYNI
jgi:sulfate transporter 4